MSLLSLSRPPSYRMKRTSLLVFALLGSVALRAQDETEHPTAPPPENLTFLTDEYIYIPKYKFSLGLRAMTGAKTSFSGRGVVASTLDSIGAATGTGFARTYHDGSVSPDTRTVSTDDGNGGNVNVPIAPDGKTNNWTYVDPTQVTPTGNMAMHSYSADIVDSGPRTMDAKNAYGFEVVVAQDMGKIGTHFEWNLAAGFSLNDLSSGIRTTVPANVTTTTDVYSLYGAPAPTAPFTGTATATSQTVVDANGNAILNSDGTVKTVSPDTVTLLGNEPLSRNVSAPVADTTSVINSWQVKGAYFTFRAGPSLLFPITSHLRASVSLGAALVYAGTTYTVRQQFSPATGDPINLIESDSANHFLPGYYADADVEYWLTDTAGFYAGAVYQNTGTFKQEVKTDTADFTTKVDMSSLSGLRAGVNIKF
jgi:hypothetical protein